MGSAQAKDLGDLRVQKGLCIGTWGEFLRLKVWNPLG